MTLILEASRNDRYRYHRLFRCLKKYDVPNIHNTKWRYYDGFSVSALFASLSSTASKVVTFGLPIFSLTFWRNVGLFFLETTIWANL